MSASPSPRPLILTIDCVLLSLCAGPAGRRLSVALVDRPHPPFAGLPALPGGYVHLDKDVDLADTARRVLADKLGLEGDGLFLEQLATVSGRDRDPRGWSATVVYYALLPEARLTETPGIGGRLWPVDALPNLAFDHAAIVAQAVERLRAKTGYSNLPGFLLPDTFTLPELQEVYEQLLERRIDQSVFRRRMDELGLIEAIPDGFRKGGRHRPAQLYRLRQTMPALHKRAIPSTPRPPRPNP